MKPLEPVIRGHRPCGGSLAATAEAVLSSSDLVAIPKLHVYVQHGVHKMITALCNSAGRPSSQKVTIHCCDALNPETFLPHEGDMVPPDCLTLLKIAHKPRPDLSVTPGSNSNMVPFVGGSPGCPNRCRAYFTFTCVHVHSSTG